MLEVILTIAILGVVGFILSDSLISTFKSTDKTALLGNVKQNGQTALNLISASVRNADNIVCVGNFPSLPPSTTLLLFNKGRYQRFSICIEPADKSKNGYLAQDTPTIADPRLASTYCSGNQDTAHETILTDISPSSGVSVKSGKFTYSLVPGYSDLVTVQFELGTAVNSGSGFSNQLGGSGKVLFQTTIQTK